MVTFSQKLRKLMKELGINQKELSTLTGIKAPSLSQYMTGQHEPSKARQGFIAETLGMKATYFEIFEPSSEIVKDVSINLPIPLVAKLMGKSIKFVEQGLQDGVFPWGYAVKLTKWSYFISAVKFTEHTGIPIPVKKEEAPTGEAMPSECPRTLTTIV